MQTILIVRYIIVKSMKKQLKFCRRNRKSRRSTYTLLRRHLQVFRLLVCSTRVMTTDCVEFDASHPASLNISSLRVPRRPLQPTLKAYQQVPWSRSPQSQTSVKVETIQRPITMSSLSLLWTVGKTRGSFWQHALQSRLSFGVSRYASLCVSLRVL